MNQALRSGGRPRVSVLMAVFNTAEFVGDALRSVSNQDFDDLEIIVIDDGSSDGSAEVLRAHARLEPRMHLVNRENRGLVATRNELLFAASGDLVAWMDSDDLSSPQRLALQVRELDRRKELVCIGTNVVLIDPQGRRLGSEIYHRSHADVIAAQRAGGGLRFPSTMMRREAAIRAGGFREPFAMGEDLDLLLRLSEIGEVGNIPGFLYTYRLRVASVCATLGPKWVAYRDLILALAEERRSTGLDRLQRGEVVTLDRFKPIDRSEQLAAVYLTWSKMAAGLRDFDLARTYARAAIEASPRRWAAWKALLRSTVPL